MAAKKIYFCGSIRAGRQDVDLYERIIQILGRFGEVLTPFVGEFLKLSSSCFSLSTVIDNLSLRRQEDHRPRIRA